MDAKELAELQATVGWRVSPLATALTFSKEENEAIRFESSPHLSLISDAIVDAVNGDGKQYIIVSMPPRHGKSTLVTRRTPEWFLANYPYLTVGMCGYGADFATEWGRKVRNDLAMHKHRLGFDLAEDSQKKDWWHTDRGGGMWTAGVGGQITGKGADLLVVDDPIKSTEEAYSPAYRDKLWTWWMRDVQSRTYPHSVICIVMTRWHTDDLVGRLLSKKFPGDPNRWRYIEMPAIWGSNVPDEIGRRKGESLWPEHFPVDWLISERKDTIDEEGWQSLYQQQPLNTTGIGVAYHAFSERDNVTEVVRDDSLALAWSLDFNVDPMTAVLGQVRDLVTARSAITGERLTTIEILDELVLPNSNTPQMCQEFDARVRKYARGKNVEIHVYGDATASRRDTRGLESDWDIIFKFLQQRGWNYKNFVTKTDPLVRDRVNSMNAALKSMNGVIRLMIDERCTNLIADLKEVRWKRDKDGNAMATLDKSDKERTHVSDACGYLVCGKLGIRQSGGEMSGLAQ